MNYETKTTHSLILILINKTRHRISTKEKYHKTENYSINEMVI